MFLPGTPCGCCDGEPPCACLTGSLPETVTVAFDGFDSDDQQGPFLTSLVFQSNFGSGAAGRVSSPSGSAEDAGPITAVELTDNGSGYARVSRVEPVVSASVSSGTGASLAVSLTETVDDSWQVDGRAVWQVTGVSVTSGGTGYQDGQSVAFTAGSGSTKLASAVATINTGRTQPTLTASASSSSGSGAELSVSLAQTADWNGKDVWSVSSVGVVAAGESYQPGDQVLISVTDGVQPPFDFFYAEVFSVDEDGGIESVSVFAGGEYYKSTGIIESVSVSNGGAYYKEDSSIPGEAADVQISVAQYGPTAGTAGGAILEAVIDTDPASETFGQITEITIEDGGDGYLAWASCESYVRNETVVLRKGAGLCLYSNNPCFGTVLVEYRGPSQPPVVSLSSGACSFFLSADAPVEDCSDFSFVASDEAGRSATVTPGGEYPDSEGDCSVCTGTVDLGGVSLPIDGPWVATCVEQDIERPTEAVGFYPKCAIGYARARVLSCGSIGGLPVLFIAVEAGASYIVSATNSVPYQCSDYSGYDYVVGDEIVCENVAFPNCIDSNLILTGAQRVFAFGPLFGVRCLDGPTEYINTQNGDGSWPCSGELSENTWSTPIWNIECGK